VNNELIINVVSSEIQIALLEDKELIEFSKERNNKQFTVGDIYLGKVKKIMPGLNAAFVDVGYEKDAFLHYLDLGPQFRSLTNYLNESLNPAKNKQTKNYTSLSTVTLVPDINKNGKITEVLNPGQSVLVQIAKEPISTKGPRISCEISIAGRHLVLLPFSDKVSISQKIESKEERSRLKRLIQSIKPLNYGVIVRTASESKKVATLDIELRELVKTWESAFQNLAYTKPPKLVIGELNRTAAILRDILSASFNSIHVNDYNTYKEIKDYIENIAPEKSKIVKHYSSRIPVFNHFGINKQIKALFGKTVTIKNGAYLIIEHTEALHVIDVNSGNRSKKENDQETNALEVNIAAAEEIARQLRLRDMGGIIVVDFIDMHEPENRLLLFEKMKEMMAKDRTKHNILPLSKFGLMQITRQRVRPEMNIRTVEKCPTCSGSGEITPSILFIDQLENNIKYIRRFNQSRLTLKVHPYIAAYLKQGLISVRTKWCIHYRTLIRIKPDTTYTLLEYHFFDQIGEELSF